MSEVNYHDLSVKLRELRKAFCMTQDEVAEVLGMSRTSFSKYENGATFPPLNVMRKLSKVYNVPIEYLIHNNDTVFEVHDDKNTEEPDPNNLAASFAQLTPEERLIIMKVRLLTLEQKKDFLKNLNDYVD